MSPQGPDADDSFFNDLSRQPDRDDGSSASRSNSIDAALPAQNDAAAGATAAAGAVSTTDPAGGTPKLKRIACVLCRKRKLRCDGARPTCGTCKRLSHDCAYDEVRRKSGPKRGYVKQLEARLKQVSEQVENLLKNQDEHGPDGRESSNPSFSAPSVPQGMGRDVTNLGLGGNPDAIPQIVPPGGLSPEEQMLQGGSGSLEGTSVDGGFPFEMIGLGLQEPLPPADVIDELHHIYFEKVHSSVPMIHRRRYLAAMNLGPNMRPPVCLRYIIWCLAASVSDKYECFQDHFYQRARKYAQIDEMKGHGESTISIAHCQTWVLICSYEFKLMYFPRAWMSTGRAVRLAQMMQLHRLDGQGLDVKQCLPPPKDWTEKEERRRTFWMAYCQDRYASIGTGWPMTIEEKDIMTNLPAIDDAYDKSKPMQTASLEQTFSLSGPSHLSTLSPFGGIVLMATLFGRNLTHLHRPTPNDNDHDIDGEFWKRHRQLDNILMQTTLGLPDHLRLPAGMQDPNVVFMNMSIHTSAICLHQAAIFKADQNHLSPSIGSESKIRCITAAAEITNIMRTIYTQDVAAMNPFVVFCLYVAARVFIQYLRSQPKDQQITSSLQFLLSAMQALKRKNPLSDSFLAQLDVDLEGAGIPGIPRHLDVSKSSPAEGSAGIDIVRCSPLIEIRDSQSNKNSHLTPPSRPRQIPHNPSAKSFHTGVNIDYTDCQDQYVYMQRAQGGQDRRMDLPNRRKSPCGLVPTIRNSVQGVMGPVEQINTDSEMDTSPDGSGGAPMEGATPETSASQPGSSSHTSFTPPQMHGSNNTGSPGGHVHGGNHQQQGQRSRTGSERTPSVPTSSAGPSYFPVSDVDFNSIDATHFFSQSGAGQDHSVPFGIGNSWEISGSTGFTPLPSDESWGFEPMGNEWGGIHSQQQFDLNFSGAGSGGGGGGGGKRGR